MRAYRAREEARLRAKAAELGIDIALHEAEALAGGPSLSTRLWKAIQLKEAEALN
jgi:hypothetical protein